MPSKKYTEAQKKSAKKWDAANLDRMSIAMPKGKRDIIKSHAAKIGLSMNTFIIRAIDEAIERDNIQTGDSIPTEEAGA